MRNMPAMGATHLPCRTRLPAGAGAAQRTGSGRLAGRRRSSHQRSHSRLWEVCRARSQARGRQARHSRRARTLGLRVAEPGAGGRVHVQHVGALVPSVGIIRQHNAFVWHLIPAGTAQQGTRQPTNDSLTRAASSGLRADLWPPRNSRVSARRARCHAVPAFSACLSAKVKGPFSWVKPIKLEHPGPPLSHKTCEQGVLSQAPEAELHRTFTCFHR